MTIQLPTSDEPAKVIQGDALELLSGMPSGSVQTCVTSPPYWGGVRDYGHDAQLGMERDPADYADVLARVFHEVRRVLRPDGTLWLNIGDVYAASGKGGGGSAGDRKCWSSVRDRKGFRAPPEGFKHKDLTFAPFIVADALRRDGWYSRSVIVWEKPSAVEPTRADRPAVCHEYLFLMSASKSYRASDPGEPWWGRSVWKIDRAGDSSHPASMPAELARRCVVSSSKPGDTVLDPFAGGGTTLEVAVRYGRLAVGLELNPAYAAIARRRIDEAMGVGGLYENVKAKASTPELFAETE